jgi:hypothetical protein
VGGADVCVAGGAAAVLLGVSPGVVEQSVGADGLLLALLSDLGGAKGDVVAEDG